MLHLTVMSHKENRWRRGMVVGNSKCSLQTSEPKLKRGDPNVRDARESYSRTALISHG